MLKRKKYSYTKENVACIHAMCDWNTYKSLHDNHVVDVHIKSKASGSWAYIRKLMIK